MYQQSGVGGEPPPAGSELTAALMCICWYTGAAQGHRVRDTFCRDNDDDDDEEPEEPAAKRSRHDIDDDD